MEDGGSSLFDFVQKSHTMIKMGLISNKHWQQVVRVIFKQLIEAIEYIHSKNICHFDVSLENILINDVQVVEDVDHDRKNVNIRFLLESIQIKLCDFGMFIQSIQKQHKLYIRI